MINCDDYTTDGVTDWKAYRAASVAAGEACQKY